MINFKYPGLKLIKKERLLIKMVKGIRKIKSIISPIKII